MASSRIRPESISLGAAWPCSSFGGLWDAGVFADQCSLCSGAISSSLCCQSIVKCVQRYKRNHVCGCVGLSWVVGCLNSKMRGDGPGKVKQKGWDYAKTNF